MSSVSIGGKTCPKCKKRAVMRGHSSKIKGFTIDPTLFDKGYRDGCGPSRCMGQCCAEGVYISQEEHQAILQYADRIVKQFDETQPRDAEKWFEPARIDEDYPAGVCIGTRVYNNKCVFLDKQCLCVLQKVKLEGIDQKWGLKPLYCRTYPITVEHGTITYERTVVEETACCSIDSRHTRPVVEVCREELAQILGEDGYRELLADLRNRRRLRS